MLSAEKHARFTASRERIEWHPADGMGIAYKLSLFDLSTNRLSRKLPMEWAPLDWWKDPTVKFGIDVHSVGRVQLNSRRAITFA
jgi:hypothetical protein